MRLFSKPGPTRKASALRHLIAISFVLLGAQGALAEAYPKKPITIIMPYTPGGPTDIVAWVVGQKLGERLGQQVIVDNRRGAGGNIGAALVARAAPDGYTLLLCTTAHAINPSVFPALNYDILKDFSPVVLLTTLLLLVMYGLGES
jgi:tripartite-type tricarboxylate transporter receptor subunit TctC